MKYGTLLRTAEQLQFDEAEAIENTVENVVQLFTTKS